MAGLSLRLLKASEFEVAQIALHAFDLLQEGEYMSGGLADQLEEDTAVFAEHLIENARGDLSFPELVDEGLHFLGHDPEGESIEEGAGSYVMMMTGIALDRTSSPPKVSASGIERIRLLEQAAGKSNGRSNRCDDLPDSGDNLLEKICRGAGSDGGSLPQPHRDKRPQGEEIDLAKEALVSGEIVSTKEAAEILDLTDTRVKQFAQEGRIGTKVGRAFLFTRRELAEFAAEERPSGRRHQY